MSEIFLTVVNMSISAGYIVLAVLLLRLVLRKAPKWIFVVLWGIVAVRLICPLSIESMFSLIPKAEVVSPNIMLDRHPQINTGIPVVNQVINPIIAYSFAPDPATSANPLQLWIPTFAALWIAGMAVLLVYAIISYVRVKHRVGTAVRLQDGIYQSENVDSPFVLGIIKPKIYLPFYMSEKDMPHIVAHETAHIRRKDHLWKPLGFLLLTLHWFNPLMWLGYVLLCRDIELACDEKVIKELDRDARADYSETLLACSGNRRMLAACPLAFGEVGVTDRVKSVLNYKKTAFWVIAVALVACIAVAVCFLTNPKSGNYGETDPNKLSAEQAALMTQYPEYFGLDASEGLDIYVWQMAKDSYSFGLLPHSSIPRNAISEELTNLAGVSDAQVCAILASYQVDRDQIYVIPFQHILSSYLGDWQIVADGEDIEAKRKAYAESVRKMLFDRMDGVKEQAGISLVYNAPMYSYVMAPSEVPAVIIEGDVIYTVTGGNKERYGTVTKQKLEKSNFDVFFQGVGQGEYENADYAVFQYGKYNISELIVSLRENNKTAYEVTPDSTAKGIEIYYVMKQNNGETLIVYGHYADGQKTNEIRFVYSIEL